MYKIKKFPEKRIKFFSSLAVLLLSAFLVFSVSGNFSNRISPLAGGTKLYVDPPLTSQPVGSNFTIEVRLSDVEDLFGLAIEFEWDPTILDYVDHLPLIPVEDYPDGILYEPILMILDNVNAVTGLYELACSSLGGSTPSFNGSGIVFNMTFDVLAEGISGLDFLLDDLARSTSAGGGSIAHQVINGTFDNRPANGQLVVRGTDDGVWYRSFNGTDWGVWGGFGGVTYDTPAAEIYDGQLYVVANGTNGALWWRALNLTDDSFSEWQNISGHGTPTLTATGTNLTLVVRGTDDGVWYRSFDGADWGVWGGLGGLTHDVPAAAVFGEQLHVVVNGTDGGLWWCSVDLDGGGFSGWQGISGTGVPALTAHDGVMYLVVRGTDDGVWYRSFDGADWGVWGGLGGLTHDVPAAAVFGEQLHVVVNGTDGGLWWCSVDLDGGGFSGWQGISGYGTPVLTSTIPIP